MLCQTASVLFCRSKLGRGVGELKFFKLDYLKQCLKLPHVLLNIALKINKFPQRGHPEATVGTAKC